MKNNDYYSFKTFSLFWLVETTCIIHHNQLLLTKFGKNFVILNQWHENPLNSAARSLQIIELMTSKWCQKCSLLQIIERLTKKIWGRGCVIFGEQKNELIFSFESLKISWIIKQLLNSAFVGYEEFCKILKILLSLIQ